MINFIGIYLITTVITLPLVLSYNNEILSLNMTNITMGMYSNLYFNL